MTHDDVIAVRYVATRYNLIYAFKDHREGGGTHWPLNGKEDFEEEQYSDMLLLSLSLSQCI